MTNETDTFVQEVDEKLREDRLMAFVRRWGVWILGAVIVVVLGIGGWQWWRSSQVSQARGQSDLYIAAQELAAGGDLAGAKSAFEELTTSGPQAYRVMARMEHSAILAEEGDLEGALAGFDQAAEQASDPIMRDSARMRAAYLAAETQDFQALQTRLQPLIDSDSRVSYLARELLAIEAWEAGQNDLARTTLEALSLAFDAPEAVRQRAQVALSVIGPATSGETASPQPAPSEGETK